MKAVAMPENSVAGDRRQTRPALVRPAYLRKNSLHVRGFDEEEIRLRKIRGTGAGASGLRQIVV